MPRAAEACYQLLGEIARGGMGVVLKGRDPDLGRDLAFKVLKAELAGRPGAEQRFVEEAQVGGQLQHPGVVPVYDLGRFADGRPFFAMKLVKGRTLAEALAERADPAADRGRFLHVFLQVCQTVAYAHSRGVIHRDLKPANVMVGSFGEVLVMDWGLAKVLPRGGVADEDRATRAARERERPEPEPEPTVIHTARSGSGSDTAAGSVMGTPAYMSPEQAGGEIDKLDERADVFGLGAVLCVVLTGRPPYLAASAEATRLMAIRGALDDSFARLDGCGADAELVALCKRCLAADRDARPRHAGEVAGAVSAHLAGVEGRARRAELDQAAAAAEAREQRKRRRVQLALAAAVGLLLLGGGAAGWWLDKQAGERRAERDRLEGEATAAALRQQVEDERRASAERERVARNVDALADLVGRCEECLRRADPEDADRAAGLLKEVDRRLPDGGGESVADRVARCRTDLAMLKELDRIEIDQSVPRGGRVPEVKDIVARRRAVFVGLGADPVGVPPAEAARRVAQSLLRDRLVDGLDEWLAQTGEPGARAVLRAADPDPYRDAMRDAVAGRDRDRLLELIERSDLQSQSPKFITIFAQYLPRPDKRREVLEAALRRRPGDLQLLARLGMMHPVGRGDRDGGTERARWAQAAFAAHPRSVLAHSAMVVALWERGELRGAIWHVLEILRLDPENPIAHGTLGELLDRTGDPEGAVEHLRKAVQLDPDNLLHHDKLASLLAARGDLPGEIRHRRETVRLAPKDGGAHSMLGAALRRQGKLDEALKCHEEAVRLDPEHAGVRNNLGRTLHDLGELDRAIDEYRTAIRLDAKGGGKVARTYFNLGNALADRGDLAEAVAAHRRAVELEPANPEYQQALAAATRRADRTAPPPRPAKPVEP